MFNELSVVEGNSWLILLGGDLGPYCYFVEGI